MVEIINDNPLINVEVSCDTAKVEIKLGNQTNVDVELQEFIKGDTGPQGSTGSEIIVADNGYQLTHTTNGRRIILMIQLPNLNPKVILHPGPNPIGPIHVFAPNAPKYSYIELLYAFDRWLKITTYNP